MSVDALRADLVKAQQMAQHLQFKPFDQQVDEGGRGRPFRCPTCSFWPCHAAESKCPHCGMSDCNFEAWPDDKIEVLAAAGRSKWASQNEARLAKLAQAVADITRLTALLNKEPAR